MSIYLKKYLILPFLQSEPKQKKMLGLFPEERTAKTLEKQGFFHFAYGNSDSTSEVLVLRADLLLTKTGIDKISSLKVNSGCTKTISANNGEILGGLLSSEFIKNKLNIEKERMSITDIMEILKSNETKNSDFILQDGDYFVLNSKDSWLKAQKYLINSLRKPIDGIISKALNRPISLRISSFLVKTPLTPNQITIFVFILSLISAVFMGFGYFVLGAILMQVSSILDGCDGEVARLKFKHSESGAWLDTVLDDTSNFIFICATGVGLWMQNPKFITIILTVIVPLFGIPAELYIYRKLKEKSISDIGLANIKENSFIGRMVNVAKNFTKRDFYYFIFLIFAIMGIPYLIIIFSAMGSIGVCIGIFANRKSLQFTASTEHSF